MRNDTHTSILAGLTQGDVILLDAQNRPIGTYNLTIHDLGNPAHYAELRTLLVNAASAP